MALCSFESSLSHGCLNYNLLVSPDLRLVLAQPLPCTFNAHHGLNGAAASILGKQTAHNLYYMTYAIRVGLGLGGFRGGFGWLGWVWVGFFLSFDLPLKSFPAHLSPAAQYY